MKTAMILAAGRGERLRPLTDITPKALCKIHNIPLIEYHVINLAQAGFNRLIINHAWLGGQIRQHLGNGARWGIDICYMPEPPGGLETGGGIVNALPFLGKQPFITVNADIFTDYDFTTLGLITGKPVHLILIKAVDGSGDFGLSSTGVIENDNREYTFSGIACYQPELFEDLKPGRYSITPILRHLAMKGEVTGTIHTGKWVDTGSLERLQLAASL